MVACSAHARASFILCVPFGRADLGNLTLAQTAECFLTKNVRAFGPMRHSSLSDDVASMWASAPLLASHLNHVAGSAAMHGIEVAGIGAQGLVRAAAVGKFRAARCVCMPWDSEAQNWSRDAGQYLARTSWESTVCSLKVGATSTPRFWS